MNTLASTPDFLLPWGRILLIGAFGAALVLAVRESSSLEGPFVGLVIGVLGLTLYKPYSTWLSDASQQLVREVALVSDRDDLKSFILNAMERASKAPDAAGGLSIPGFVEQAWRLGVWGVLSVVVQFVFLLSSLILECAQAVLWKLILILFPLACGLFPIAPGILKNLSLYSIELSLWLPILALVEVATSSVARMYVIKEGSLGLFLVATELVAILLILSVPAITHRFLGGAFSGDLGSGASVLNTAKKALAWSRLRAGG